MDTTFNFQFLGTSACDFSPRLETDCKNKFDKDARRSSCGLLNGQYLVDCGLHTIEALGIAGVELSRITDVFITHTHADHCIFENVEKIAKAKDEPLKVWINEEATPPELFNVEYRKMGKKVQYEVSNGLSVIGLGANHDESAHPQHLLFEKNGKRFLYACDGAWMLRDTYYYLLKQKLSLYVVDCTSGDYIGDYRMGEHNSIPMIRLMLPSLKTWGVIDENSKIYISHLAPSLHKPHDETVEIMKEMGVNVAYDGLVISI